MSEKVIENNKVVVIGEVISDFTFSHEVFGEGFYLTEILVNRLSDQVDVILEIMGGKEKGTLFLAHPNLDFDLMHYLNNEY